MKRIVAVLMALTAICCFAGCTDGKCDNCDSKKDLHVYDIHGEEKELCPLCYAKEVKDDVLGDLGDLFN